MKRIVLFLATNLAILILLGIVTTLVQGYLADEGIEFERSGLLIFAAIFAVYAQH